MPYSGGGAVWLDSADVPYLQVHRSEPGAARYMGGIRYRENGNRAGARDIIRMGFGDPDISMRLRLQVSGLPGEVDLVCDGGDYWINHRASPRLRVSEIDQTVTRNQPREIKLRRILLVHQAGCGREGRFRVAIGYNNGGNTAARFMFYVSTE